MTWDLLIEEIEKYAKNGDPIKDVLEKYCVSETEVILYLIEELKYEGASFD